MNRVLNHFSNLLLLLLGTESIGLLIAETFSISVPPLTWAWLAVLCVLLWVASSFRRGILIGMPLCAAVLWYLYKIDEEDLLIEFQDLLEHVNAAYFGHFSGSGSVYLYSDQAAGHMTALLFVLFLLAAFLSVSLASGGFRISLSHLATIPLFAVCITVNGTPSVLPVLGVLLFWCGVHLSGDVCRPADAAGKGMLLGLLPCLLVLSGLLLLYNPSNYQYSERDIDLSQRFDRFGNALSKWMNRDGGSSEGSSTTGETSLRSYEPPSGWRSGTDDLVLTRSFDYSALDEEAFRVESDAAGSLYFRGKSYGDYRGNAWEAAIENTHQRALGFTARAVQNSRQEERDFQLQSDVAYDLLYLPYFSIADTENDVKFSNDGLRNYGGGFFQCYEDLAAVSRLSLSGSSASDEKQYREYAHTYYTRLPDSTRFAMADVCRSFGLTDELGTAELILAVADTVRSRGIYDINAEPYAGSDYALDFLTSTYRGYCIHYATAATVLYRALGIPARVCEGYLVSFLDNSTVVVTGRDAHAWVEVYLDGVGWYPVEVTASPADSPDSQAYGTEQSPNQPEESPAEPDSESEPETPVTPEDQEEGPAEGSETSEEEAGGGSESSPDGKDGADASGRLPVLLLRLLLIPAGILLLAAAVYGRYRFLRSRLQKRLSVTNGRLLAVAAYRQADRLCRWGAEIPAVIRTTAEKAAFSQHEINEEEQKAVLSALNRLTNETYASLTTRQKLAFQYLFGNI